MAAPRKDEVFDEFILFKTMTQSEKIEKYGYSTHQEFAAEFDVAEKTLSQWANHDPRFQKRRNEMLVSTRLANRMTEIVDRLVERAVSDGDVAAIKEALKVAGLSIEKVEVLTSQKMDIFLEELVGILEEELEDYPDLLNIISGRIGEIDV